MWSCQSLYNILTIASKLSIFLEFIVIHLIQANDKTWRHFSQSISYLIGKYVFWELLKTDCHIGYEMRCKTHSGKMLLSLIIPLYISWLRCRLLESFPKASWDSCRSKETHHVRSFVRSFIGHTRSFVACTSCLPIACDLLNSNSATPETAAKWPL